MAYIVPKENYTGKVFNLKLGSGDRSVSIGGENVLPFLSFEGIIPNKPAIALEVQDIPPADWPETLQKVYKGVSDDPVKWAK